MRHFGAGALAGVGDAEGYRGAVTLRMNDCLQIVKMKLRIGQSEAEGKERCDALRRESAVTDAEAFAVVHRHTIAGKLIGVGRQRILDAARKAERQLAGGIHLAEQNIGNRIAILFARIPGFENGGNIL